MVQSKTAGSLGFRPKSNSRPLPQTCSSPTFPMSARGKPLLPLLGLKSRSLRSHPTSTPSTNLVGSTCEMYPKSRLHPSFTTNCHLTPNHCPHPQPPRSVHCCPLESPQAVFHKPPEQSLLSLLI